MDTNIAMRKPVQYPKTPDTTIKVGDRVRSFDFPENSLCYFVGTVDSITEYGQYKITVDYQVWEGKREETNYCAAVLPPVNGQRGIFGPTRGVQRVLQGEEPA